MRKIILILVVILLASAIVFAKLSDDTLKEVEKLSYKHYGHGTAIDCIEISEEEMAQWEIKHRWLSIWFEDGKFFVETEDGKWFIEMEKIK